MDNNSRIYAFIWSRMLNVNEKANEINVDVDHLVCDAV
jgi:hypothetical protein